MLQNSEIALEAETGGLLGVEAKSEPHCTFQNCVGYKDTVSKQKANQQPAKQKVGDTAQTDHPSALGRLRQEDQEFKGSLGYTERLGGLGRKWKPQV